MQNMLELTKQELDKHQALSPQLNTHLQRIVNAIPFATVDPRMKAVIAVSQLTSFASQFRRNILLWDDTSVPINAISFVITGSGAGKDSSVKAARKCFTSGYKMIDIKRKQLATARAIEAATNAGEELPHEFDVYKAYLPPVPPIDIMPTTGPGLIQHINDIGDLNLSTGFMYSGEVSDELAYNQDMMENIKVLSEIYDTGDKEVKYTKGIEHRSRAIVGQPVSALFVGSPGHILYDPSTKKKFDIAFMSKLARRSWFCYTPERIPEPIFDTVQDMILHQANIENKAKAARESMTEHIQSITQYNLDNKDNLTVTDDVFYLFETYKRYNSDFANNMPNQDSTSALIRRHLQWKAIKLAGAFCVFDKMDVVQAYHYVDAIRFCELLAQDMELFEYDLNKSAHERFADYIRTIVQVDGKASMSVHDIKKQGYISSTTKLKLQELATLCGAYDNNGIYSLSADASAITYEPIVKSEKLNVSFKSINISNLNAAVKNGNSDVIKQAKHDIAMSAVYGFETGETTFEDLGVLLTKDLAYSPFLFKNNTRGKDNILGGTKWLVFDIDNSHISASEAHFLLSDINHHIALSSNSDNDYKFRLLVELDSIIELDNITWKYFYSAVADSLALQVDLLGQSQIFFSYSGRPIISVTDASPLIARQFVIDAKEKRAMSVPKKLSSAQEQALLSDPLETFSYCFECPLDGPGSRSIIRMAYHARDLGATKEQTLDLLQQVQDYWEYPLEETRMQKLHEQVERLF